MSRRLVIEGQLERADFALKLALEFDLSSPVGLMGPTGAGKTTLLRVLAGLEPSFRGRITFCDEVWSDTADVSAGFSLHMNVALGSLFKIAGCCRRGRCEGIWCSQCVVPERGASL